MSRREATAAGLGVLALLLAAVLPAATVRADHDHERHEHPEDDDRDARKGSAAAPRPPVAGDAAAPQASRSVAPAANGAAASSDEALYREECGSCHLAHPPGLLPAASWRSMMAGLDRHFGQHAELDPQSAAALTAWLTANAAEAGTHPLSRKVLRSSGGTAPRRISEVPFIAHEHRELAPSVWSRPSVGSVANCAACHRGAEQGDFDDDRISIPK